jgi:hypothetical protein
VLAAGIEWCDAVRTEPGLTDFGSQINAPRNRQLALRQYF